MPELRFPERVTAFREGFAVHGAVSADETAASVST